jgi:hypothetical protein
MYICAEKETKNTQPSLPPPSPLWRMHCSREMTQLNFMPSVARELSKGKRGWFYWFGFQRRTRSTTLPLLGFCRSIASHILSLKLQKLRGVISIIHAFSVCITNKLQPSTPPPLSTDPLSFSHSYLPNHNHLRLKIIQNVAFCHRFLALTQIASGESILGFAQRKVDYWRTNEGKNLKK